MAQQSDQLHQVLGEIVNSSLSPEARQWLEDKTHSAAQFSSAFAALPRKTGKKLITLSTEQKQAIETARPGLQIDGWSTDRLARVFLIAELDATDREEYIKSIEILFLGAEIQELVSLYSALPMLQYPEAWRGRCAEGIRSNIGDVLTAIMCDNPYPHEQLDDAAWNQLVLKAFFTEKPVHRITGLDMRANKQLAETLVDYAHERRTAHREVNPQLWRLVGPYIDARTLTDMENNFASPDPATREAAALACADSGYPPAKTLLQKHPELYSLIQSGKSSWTILAEKLSDHVLQP